MHPPVLFEAANPRLFRESLARLKDSLLHQVGLDVVVHVKFG
jgi:hypothetical protein